MTGTDSEDFGSDHLFGFEHDAFTTGGQLELAIGLPAFGDATAGIDAESNVIQLRTTRLHPAARNR